MRQRGIAEVAHLVEHDLAKVGVAGSSPVFRSKSSLEQEGIFFTLRSFSEEGRNPPSLNLPAGRQGFGGRGRPGGGIGRHAGLKILWPAMAVSVQLRSGAQKKSDQMVWLFFME